MLILITKTANTVETLLAINELRNCNVEVIFDQEELRTNDPGSQLLISILEGVAQEESEARSKSIRWGIIRKAEDGTSSLYKRKCYGYCAGENGEFQINESEASVVKDVFDMYLQGKSIIRIKRELESHGIKSPTGNDVWCKRSIDVMLSNEKYSGDVIVFKTFNSGYPNSKRKDNEGEWNKFLSVANHPAIISKEVFSAVQEEKARRSNIIKNDNGSSRKPTRYSSPRNSTT